MSHFTLGHDFKADGDLTVEIVGMNAVSARLEAIALLMPGAATLALHDVAVEEIMPVAKERVPVDQGELIASGYVLPPEQHGDETHVTMGFGGPAGSGNLGETNTIDVDYAVKIHEDMEMHHPNGQAKYLESAVLEAIPSIADMVAERLDGRLGSAIG